MKILHKKQYSISMNKNCLAYALKKKNLIFKGIMSVKKN